MSSHFDQSEKSQEQKHDFFLILKGCVCLDDNLKSTLPILMKVGLLYRCLEIINFWKWSDTKWPTHYQLIKH